MSKLELEEIKYSVLRIAYAREVEVEDNGTMMRLYVELDENNTKNINSYRRLRMGMLSDDLNDLGIKTTGMGTVKEPYVLQFYVDVIGTLREEVTDKEL